MANRAETSIPDSLKEDLEVWKYRGPQIADFSAAIELFPAASYQYVLYGMGFTPDFSLQSHLYREQALANKVMDQNKLITQQKLNSLPNHRDYISQWLEG